MNQSEPKANAFSRRKARENAGEQVMISWFGWKSGAIFINYWHRVELQKSKQMRLISTLYWKPLYTYAFIATIVRVVLWRSAYFSSSGRHATFGEGYTWQARYVDFFAKTTGRCQETKPWTSQQVTGYFCCTNVLRWFCKIIRVW